MSAGLERIRQEMADYLNSREIPAVTAWPGGPQREREEAVVAVSVRGCRIEPVGFQNYLGEGYDTESSRWIERYGKKVRLTFGLDLYAPERGSGEGLQAAFDRLAGALLLEGPEGMEVQELSCGQIVWDRESRRLKQPAEAVCGAWLCAAADGKGLFTDFELRGVLRQ